MDSWNFILLSARSFSLLGPLTLNEVSEAFQNRKISFSDMVYISSGRPKWRRVYEVPELMKLIPAAPTSSELSVAEAKILSKKLETSAPPSAIPTNTPSRSSSSSSHSSSHSSPSSVPPPLSKRQSPPPIPKTSSISKSGPSHSTSRGSSSLGSSGGSGSNERWYLQAEGSEYGPFSRVELDRLLTSGKLEGNIFGWKNGMDNWVVVESFDQLLRAAQRSNTQKFQIERGTNKRADIRMSIVATVSVFINSKPLVAGICADISENGLQLINLFGPELSVGQRAVLLISPAKMSGVSPFKVQARVAWTGDNPPRAGFQFQSTVTSDNLISYLKKMRITFGI